MSRAEVCISPEFNNLVVFTTTPTSFHGHPAPIAGPPGTVSRSIAPYCYTEAPGPGSDAEPYLTLFQTRRSHPGDPSGVMRIACWHNLTSGGAKRVLYDQVRGLVRRGHHVEAWCPPTTDGSFLPLDELVEEHVVALRPPGPCSRLSIREAFADHRNDISAMDEHCGAVAAEISASGFEVLLAHSCNLYRTTAVGRFASVPSVLFAEPYRPLYEASPGYPWAAAHRPPEWWKSWAGLADVARDALRTRSRRIQVREEITNAKAYDQLLAYSFFTREMILRSYGVDATVCYPGVDTTRFRPLGLPREPFVISVGAVCLEKNMEFVVAAVAELPASHRRLVWVADQVERSAFERASVLARRTSVSLELEQRVDETRLVELLNRAGVMAFAPRLEPLGLAPLEAAACELAVVAVGEAGVRETVVPGVTGVLTAKSVPEFARAMRRVLNEPDRAAAYGKAGRARVLDMWSSDSALDRLERQLVEVARSGG